MAEGWARELRGDLLEVYSAGIEKHALNTSAVRVMSEAGVDISCQRPQRLEELGPIEPDWVVTVCGHAHENCPVLPGGTRVKHVGFDDPPKLAARTKNPEEAIAIYRRVRDEIRRFVETLPDSLNE